MNPQTLPGVLPENSKLEPMIPDILNRRYKHFTGITATELKG
jgi:hypothetical protein